MKNRIRPYGTLIAALALAAPAPAAPQGTYWNMATEVTRGEITWRFDTWEAWGAYANGDILVLGPVTITEILPETAYDAGVDWWKNGTQIFPHPGKETPNPQSIIQGLDNTIYDQLPLFPHGHGYDHSLNIAADLPFNVETNVSVRVRRER